MISRIKRKIFFSLFIEISKFFNVQPKYYKNINTKNRSFREEIFTALFEENQNCEIVLIDVGSNIGEEISALKNVAQKLNRMGKVFSYEPHPIFYNKLEKKFNNEIRNGFLRISNLAIGANKEGKLYFRGGILAENGSASLNSNKININKRDYVIVKCLSICSAVENAISLSKDLNNPIYVLKLDVEGTEFEILNDLANCESIEKISFIFFEDHFRRIENLAWQIKRLYVYKKYQKLKRSLYEW